jgi:Amt family ammonium transporter
MKLGTFLIFVFFWTTLVYDTVAHWIWSAYPELDTSTGEEIIKFGWLRQLGSLDFAGGTAVHISSGVSSMVASSILPPRKNVNMKHKADNVGWVILGTALLWFGWFGFNSGSALAGDGLAAQAFITTQTAASTGFITWILLDFGIKKKSKTGGGGVWSSGWFSSDHAGRWIRTYPFSSSIWCHPSYNNLFLAHNKIPLSF